VAFVVSFAGHRFLSFKDTSTSVATSLRRFVVTALGGFASNELVFVLLLRGLGLPGLLALLIALVFAAGQTFVLSRFWAFKR
jgi:putative flippase GtrA